jgi:HK97 family phage prohead protease
MPQPDHVKDFNKDRHLFFFVKGFEKEDSGIIYVTASTDLIDRYNEIVLPSAFEESLPAFKANPVVLACHQHHFPNGEPPVIGNVVVETIAIHDHFVDMGILYDDDELGQKWDRKYRKKVMRAVSIGFRGIDGHYETIDGKQIWVWTKIELLELSPVAVPANPSALSRVAGYYDHEDDGRDTQLEYRNLRQEMNELKSTIDNLQSSIDNSLEDLKTLLTPDQDGLAKGLLLGELDVLSDPAGADIAEQIDKLRDIFDLKGN